MNHVAYKQLQDDRWAIIEIANQEPVQYIQEENKGLLQQWEDIFENCAKKYWPSPPPTPPVPVIPPLFAGWAYR